MKNMFDTWWKRQKDELNRFKKNAIKLWSASRLTFLLMGISATYIGLFPILQLIVLYGLVDALILARDAGVWTKDVQIFAWYEVVIVFVFFFFSGIFFRFTGVLRNITYKIARAIALFTTFFAALPIAPILLFATLCTSIVLKEVKRVWVKILVSTLIAIFLVIQFIEVLRLSVNRYTTIGEVILLLGALFIFLFLLLFPQQIEE